MKELFKNVLGTFTNTPDGWSARKVTAFWFTVLATWVHYKHLTDSNAVEFLTIDCCMILLCLAIVTAEHVIQLRNGKKSE